MGIASKITETWRHITEAARHQRRIRWAPVDAQLKTRIVRTEWDIAFRTWRLGQKPDQAEIELPVGNYRWRAYSLQQFALLHSEIFVEMEYFFRSKNPKPRILDCGSNVGFAVAYFKTLYPSASIIGFEPSPASFQLLSRNVEDNRLTDVTLHNAAVGMEEGTIDFFSRGPGSLLASTAQERSVSGMAADRVAAVRLSTYIDGEIDFLKLDVEGGEHDVLRDLIETGAIRRIDQMVIEYHHHLQQDGDAFGCFLSQLEANGFGYQLRGTSGFDTRLSRGPVFQDIQIYAYRKP